MGKRHSKRHLKAVLIVGLFAVTAVLLSCAVSQKPQAAVEKHFLWEVRSGESLVFLLGSIHVAKPDIYPLPSIIETAFQFSDILAVEANVMAEESRDAQIMMLQKGSYPSWQSLYEHISPETGQLVRKTFDELENPIRNVEQLRPWMVALVLTGLKLEQLGFSSDLGIDVHFLKKAAGTKEIIELESVMEQLDMLSSFTAEEQEDFLVYTIADLELVETQIGGIFEAWSRGDAEGIEAVLTDFKNDRPGLSGVLEKMLDRRNLKMTERISAMLDQGGRYFVVVGSAHLVGEKGIIALLRNKGHEVRQL